MIIIEDLMPLNLDRSVVTIGTFDGLHQGHVHLLRQVVAKAKACKIPSVVITFQQHPAIYFSKYADKAFHVLNVLEEKKQLIGQLDIDYLVVLPFEEIAHLSGEQFIQSVLIEKFKMTHLFLGYDNKFGNDEAYDDAKMKLLADTYHFSFTRVEKFFVKEALISSTLVRQKVSEGEVAAAHTYLGYPYFVYGEVTYGQQLGRKIGFPTANIQLDSSLKLLPKNGVYAVTATIDDKTYGGMCNLGIRPTVENNNFTFEVHLFDFNQMIYKKNLKISFIKRLRAEQKFNSLEALSNQIKKDELAAREVLKKSMIVF